MVKKIILWGCLTTCFVSLLVAEEESGHFSLPEVGSSSAVQSVKPIKPIAKPQTRSLRSIAPVQEDDSSQTRSKGMREMTPQAPSQMPEQAPQRVRSYQLDVDDAVKEKSQWQELLPFITGTQGNTTAEDQEQVTIEFPDSQTAYIQSLLDILFEKKTEE